VIVTDLIFKFFNWLFDSSFSDALQSSLWFFLSCLVVFKFFSLNNFWLWLFFTFFCLSFAFAYYLRNPSYSYGDLYLFVIKCLVGVLFKKKKVK